MGRLDQIDRAKLGERIRIARTSAGLTQEQASQAIDVARTTMVAIERGDRQVRADELTKLAEVYKVSAGSLLRETAIFVDLVPQFRRTLTAASDDTAANEALALLHRVATGCAELEKRLNRSLATCYPPEVVVGDGPIDQVAEDVSLELRNLLNLGNRPIPDLVSLVELQLGIRVFFRRIHSAYDAVYAYRPEIGACILLNVVHREERIAWSLAHDLGHFMVHRQATEACKVVDGIRPPSERFADAFAGAFLMPGSAIRRRHGEFGGRTASLPCGTLVCWHASIMCQTRQCAVGSFS